MDISKYLSKVIGLYLVIVSLAMLTKMETFMSYITSLMNDAPLMFITGFFTLILGLLMVVAHNIWLWNWRVLITIISWVVLLKGASIIIHPAWIDAITSSYLQNPTVAYITAGIDLLLGLTLCYFGFRRNY